MAAYIPPGATPEEVMMIMKAAQNQGQLNQPSGWNGNSLNMIGSQSGQTGLTGSNIPQVYQNLSAMNQGIVGNGAASTQPTQFYSAGTVGNQIGAPLAQPNYASGGGGSISNSDAFFNSAKQPSISRTITTPNSSYVNGGGSGAAGGGIPSSILSALMSGYNDANAANEGRYNEAKSTLDTYGKGQANELAGDYKQDVAHQEQDAISRGLGNSTIRASLLQGARARQQNASLNLADKLAAAKVGLLQSRSDTSADPMALAQLVGQASQYGGNALGAIAAALGTNKKK